MTLSLSLLVTFVAVTSAVRFRRRVPLHHDGARPRLLIRDDNQAAVSPVLDLTLAPPDIVVNQVQDRTGSLHGFTIEPAAIRRAPDIDLPSSNPNSESDAVC